MDADASKPLAAFGFLTVLESAEHGMFGGYLVLSPQGRPLEFRCTTPLAPNRAQEILYGPTLKSYLMAEVLGQALLASAEIDVRVILTNERDMLPLGMLRPEVVACVEPNDVPLTGPPAVPSGDGEIDSADIELGGRRVSLGAHSSCTAEQLAALLAPLAAHIDLNEPFGRIRAALNEAQLASQDAAETPDDRAVAA